MDFEAERIEQQKIKMQKEGVEVPFSALYSYMKGSEVFVQSLDETPFHCKIDDNYYGPYNHLTIKPLELMNGNHFFVPLMCFAPGSEI